MTGARVILNAVKEPQGFFGRTLRMTGARVILNAVKEPQGFFGGPQNDRRTCHPERSEGSLQQHTR